MCVVCVVWNKQRLTKAELWRAIMEVSLQTPTDKMTKELEAHLNGVRDAVEALEGDGLFLSPYEPDTSS